MVSKLTSHQGGLSSPPRFWPSGQVCMSLCGFPAVSSHSSKNMHIRKSKTLLGVGVCVCPEMNWTCVFLLLNRRPSFGSHKTYKSIPERTYLCITAYS